MEGRKGVGEGWGREDGRVGYISRGDKGEYGFGRGDGRGGYVR